jgi:DNA repair protein RadD
LKYKLRPYQEDAVERTRAEIRRGNKRPLIVAPTGAGKTVIGCSIMEQAVAKSSRVLFLAHRKELIDQCSSKLTEIGEEHGVIKAGRAPAYYRPIQVASVQTMVRRVEKLNFEFDLVIIDEAHHTNASAYKSILSRYPKATVIGLTATPYRSDGKGLGEMYNALVEVTTVEQLVRDGFLVPTRVFAGKGPDLSGIKTRGGDYASDELGKAMRDRKLEGDIVREWLTHGENRITVCFATNVEHSMDICERFRTAGAKCEHLDGTTPDMEREAILARLARGETRIVSNVGVLTEGWDLPVTSAVILARPTQSRGLWRQMVGRALRPCAGKTDCIILDHAGATKEHGFITDPDTLSLEDGIKGPKRAGPTYKGPHCEAVLKSYPAFCPACGKALRSDQRKQCELHLDDGVRLQEMTPLRRRQEYYRALVDQAIHNKYKPKWVGIKFREKFGDWPDAEDKMLSAVQAVWIADPDGGVKQMEFVNVLLERQRDAKEATV